MAEAAADAVINLRHRNRAFAKELAGARIQLFKEKDVFFMALQEEESEDLIKNLYIRIKHGVGLRLAKFPDFYAQLIPALIKPARNRCALVAGDFFFLPAR